MARSSPLLVRFPLLLGIAAIWFVSVYSLPARQARPAAVTVVQPLEVQQTPSGPAVQGLFGRFGLPPTPD